MAARRSRPTPRSSCTTTSTRSGSIPDNSNHLIIGDDGGVYVSYDMSKTWSFIENLPAGLFYHVSYDMQYPYNVCGGMQDNFVWCGPSASRFYRGIMNYDWFNVQGGDGFEAVPDLRDSRIVYAESQDGNLIRRNRVTGESKSIKPTGGEHRQRQAGRAAASLELGHARCCSRRTIRACCWWRRTACSVHRSRRLVDGDQSRPHDGREPRHHRHDGAQGKRHHASRATTASRSGRRSWRLPSRRSRRA